MRSNDIVKCTRSFLCIRIHALKHGMREDRRGNKTCRNVILHTKKPKTDTRHTKWLENNINPAEYQNMTETRQRYLLSNNVVLLEKHTALP